MNLNIPLIHELIVSDAKKKWINIKNQLTKSKQHKSGSAQAKEWYLKKYLLFLDSNLPKSM